MNVQPHMTGWLPDIEPIIEAVRNAYMRKPIQIDPDLDRDALAAGLRDAIVIFRIRCEMQRGSWNERQQRGRKLLKAKTIDDILVLLEADGIGLWWRQSLFEAIPPGVLPKLASPDAGEAIGIVREYVSMLLDDRFTTKGSPTSARTVLGPGSALEWLVGVGLPPIFERHFGSSGLKAEISRATKATKIVGGKPRVYFYGAYLRFVHAVLAGEGTTAADDTLHKIILKRK